MSTEALSCYYAAQAGPTNWLLRETAELPSSVDFKRVLGTHVREKKNLTACKKRETGGEARGSRV